MDASHTPRGDEMAARVRAAAGYADLNRRQLGEALGYSVETISALFAGEKTVDRDLAHRIAEACNVPAAFLELGFAPIERPISDADRRTHELAGQITELRAAVIALVAGNLQQTRERLGLDEKDRPPGPAEEAG